MRESVVSVSQLITLDRRYLTSLAGRVLPTVMRDVEAGLRLALAL